MSAAPNPYRIDPKRNRARVREAAEHRVVTLQDESTKPPPTIGTAPWQGILFGPAFGQPSTAPSRRLGLGAKLLLGLFALALVLLVARALLRLFQTGF